MRRAAVLALVLVLAVGGCSTEEASIDPGTTLLPEVTPSTVTTTTLPPPTAPARDDDSPWILGAEDLANAAGPPRLLVSDGTSIQRIDGAATVAIDGAPALVGRALGDGRGAVVAEVVEEDRDGPRAVGLVRIDDGDASTIPVGAVTSVALHDLVVVDGSLHVLYARFTDPGPDVETTGELVRHDLDSGEVTVLAVASAPELFLTGASVGGGVVALSYVSDLTESVSFVDLAGEPVDRPSPTDDLEYNAPPLVTDAVLSRDGTELAYLEGPDVDGAEDPEARVGDWQAVVDDADGEQLRLTVADRSLVVVHLDFDGRWLLVSGETADGPVEPLLVDTEATDLAAYLVAGVAGRATLETGPAGSTP